MIFGLSSASIDSLSATETDYSCNGGHKNTFLWNGGKTRSRNKSDCFSLLVFFMGKACAPCGTRVNPVVSFMALRQLRGSHAAAFEILMRLWGFSSCRTSHRSSTFPQSSKRCGDTDGGVWRTFSAHLCFCFCLGQVGGGRRRQDAVVALLSTSSRGRQQHRSWGCRSWGEIRPRWVYGCRSVDVQQVRPHLCAPHVDVWLLDVKLSFSPIRTSEPDLKDPKYHLKQGGGWRKHAGLNV